MTATAIENSKMDLQRILQDKFGWDEFKTGQVDVMSRLMDGQSVVAVFPTGGGKSLCYQLPALTFDGLTVVVSPLIALMKDQIDQLQSRGHQAVRMDSSLSAEEYREAASQIRNGEAKLLYVAPERFFNERFRNSLDGVRISMFAIDEAHCISQWGHNFRPDYLKLATIAAELKAERVLALTATATPVVQEDICKAFSIAKEDVICTEFFRPNLHLRTQVVSEQQRLDQLVKQLQSQPSGATIVYVTLQKTAEAVAEVCAKAGLSARAYHAGMDSEKRNETQEWFMGGENRIVVATIAFGMGIDKSDIRYVFHYNPPKSIENYAQEIGRAGRDGEVSICEMLLVPDDRIVLENFVYGDTPTEQALRMLFQELDRQPDEFFVNQYKLANSCDIKSLVVKTLLTYLELDGYIKATAPRYDSFSFKPNVPSATIINQFNGEKQEFARKLLACSVKRKTWFGLEIATAMKRLNCERSRIVRALDYFGEKQWLELKVSGLVHGYRRLKPFGDTEKLAAEYLGRFQEREESEISRIDQIFELAAANSCQSAALSEYFGQPLDHDCGTCSHCIDKGFLEVAISGSSPISEQIFTRLQRVVDQNKSVLNSPRTIARFLCGLSASSLTRSKLSKHELFGVASETPFLDVVKHLKQHPTVG